MLNDVDCIRIQLRKSVKKRKLLEDDFVHRLTDCIYELAVGIRR